MNYFEFYGIPLSLRVDQAALKRQFYQFSRQYHPDFYTQESAERQAEILELSTLNNNAYKTLSNFDLRMKHLLEIKQQLKEEGQNKLPQDFLMDMMEINEQLMDLELDFDEKVYLKVIEAIQEQEDQLLSPIQIYIDEYPGSENEAEALEKIKEYYLKKRYLLRIRKNLNKFASL
ncbi:MAG: iron-sulfur cluster co-chaperone HscB C-terminal domain-containing protein [Bacteroidota bacterium]